MADQPCMRRHRVLGSPRAAPKLFQEARRHLAAHEFVIRSRLARFDPDRRPLGRILFAQSLQPGSALEDRIPQQGQVGGRAARQPVLQRQRRASESQQRRPGGDRCVRPACSMPARCPRSSFRNLPGRHLRPNLRCRSGKNGGTAGRHRPGSTQARTGSGNCGGIREEAAAGSARPAGLNHDQPRSTIIHCRHGSPHKGGGHLRSTRMAGTCRLSCDGTPEVPLPSIKRYRSSRLAKRSRSPAHRRFTQRRLPALSMNGDSWTRPEHVPLRVDQLCPACRGRGSANPPPTRIECRRCLPSPL